MQVNRCPPLPRAGRTAPRPSLHFSERRRLARRHSFTFVKCTEALSGRRLGEISRRPVGAERLAGEMFRRAFGEVGLLGEKFRLASGAGELVGEMFYLPFEKGVTGENFRRALGAGGGGGRKLAPTQIHRCPFFAGGNMHELHI